MPHHIRMETHADIDEDDLTALKTRREELRAYAAQVAEAIEGIDMPESFIEAERAARYVAIADKMIVRLPKHGTSPEDIKPARKRLRIYADRLLDKVKSFPMPETFLEGERAGRCILATDRMLGQLYEAPKLPAPITDKPAASRANRSSKDDYADVPESDEQKKVRVDAQFKEVMGMVNRISKGYAGQCGYWPDGTPYDPATPADNKHFDIIDQITMAQDIEGGSERRMAALMAGRANALIATKAWKTGHWPDGSPYSDDDDLEYFHISDRFDDKVLNRPPDPDAKPPDYTETSGPMGFPWWLIHRVKRTDSG